MRQILPALLIVLAACSDRSAERAGASGGKGGRTDTAAEPAHRILTTPSGRYRIDTKTPLDASTLPQNADLKMLDGNLARYAAQLCHLDFANKLRPDRCVLFVQPDPKGLGRIDIQDSQAG